MMTQKRTAFSDDQIKTLIKKTNVSYVVIDDMCVWDVTGLMTMIVIRGTHSDMTIPLPPVSTEFQEVAEYIQSPEVQHILEEVDPEYSEQVERSRSTRVAQQTSGSSNKRNISKRRVRHGGSGRRTGRSARTSRTGRASRTGRTGRAIRTTNTQISLSDILNTYLDKEIDMMPYGMHVGVKCIGKHMKPRKTVTNLMKI